MQAMKHLPSSTEENAARRRAVGYSLRDQACNGEAIRSRSEIASGSEIQAARRSCRLQ